MLNVCDGDISSIILEINEVELFSFMGVASLLLGKYRLLDL